MGNNINQGIKVGINKESITNAKKEFADLLRDLQTSANNKHIKIKYDLGDFQKVIDAIEKINDVAVKTGVEKVNNDLKETSKTAKETAKELKEIEKLLDTSGASNTKYGQSYEQMLKRADEIRKTVDSTAKVSYELDEGLTKVNRAVIEYTDNMGLAYKETLAWKTSLDAEGNEVETFGIVSTKAIDDIKKYRAEMEKLQNEIKKYDDFNKIRTAKLGEKLGDELGLESTKKEILDFLRETKGLNAEIIQDTQNMTKYGEAFRTVKIKVKEGKDAWKEYTLTLDQANKATYLSEGRLKDSLNRQMSFLGAFKLAFRRVFEYMFAGEVVFQIVNSFKQGFTFINELNSKLTEVGMVTLQSADRTSRLAKEYNNLAKEMKVTTEEIAKATVEFYRQGLSQTEVMKRVATTTQYAKVSNLAFDESAQILTATVNSMNVDITKATDVFTYLGDATATGADEIGRAFQKVGGTANALGVEFEKVSSWIATISSKTRESAESIGTAIKAIMARYQQLKEKGFDEEDGTKVNQVSKALNEIGIQMIDQEGNFRNFGIVMDEIGEKWDKLSNREKAYVATTLGGTHQQSRFLNLMENYNESVNLYDKSLQSAGSTQQKYNIWLESTEAHVNKLKADLEGFWITIFDSNAIKDGITLLDSVLNLLTSLAEKFGALPSVLGVVSATLSVFNKNMRSITLSFDSKNNPIFGGFIGGKFETLKKLSLEMKNLGIESKITGQSMGFFKIMSTAMDNLNIKLTATSVKMALLKAGTFALSSVVSGLIGIGVGALISIVVSGISKLIHRTEELKNKNREIFDQYNQNTQNIGANITTLSGIADEYSNLANKTNLSSIEQKKFNELSNQIAQISPEVVQSYDNQGNAVLNLKDGVQGLIEQLREKNRLENVKLANNFDNKYKEYADSVSKTNKLMNEQQEKIKQAQEGFYVGQGGDKEFVKGINQWKEYLATLDSSSNEFNTVIKIINGLEMEIQKANLKIEEQRGLINSASSEMSPYKYAVLTTLDAYSNLDSELQQFAQSLVNTLPPQEASREKMAEILQTVDSPAMREGLKQLNQLKMDKSTMSASLFNEKLHDILTNMLNILQLKGINQEDLENLFKIKSVDEANEKIKDFTTIQKEVVKSAMASRDEMKQLNQVLDEHARTGEWDYEALSKLGEKYPEILEAIGNDAVLTEVLTNKKSELTQASLTRINGEIQLAQAMFDTYQQDLQNFTNAENAKTQVANSALAQRLKLYRAETNAIEGQISATRILYDAETDPTKKAILGKQLDALGRGAMRMGSLMTKAYGDIQAEMVKATSLINNLTGFKGKVQEILNGIGGKNNDGKKNSGGSSVSTYETILDPKDAYQIKLNDLNKYLSNQDKILKSINSEVEKHLKLGTSDGIAKAIAEENKLYQEQQKTINMLNNVLSSENATKNEIASKFSSMWGINVTNYSETDFENAFNRLFPTKKFSSKASQQRYEQQKALFRQLMEDWFIYNDAIDNTNQKIEDMQQELINTLIKSYDLFAQGTQKVFSEYEKTIDNIKSEMDLLSSNGDFSQKEIFSQEILIRTQQYKEEVEKTIQKLKEKQKNLKENSEEWLLIDGQVEDYTEKLKEINKQLKDAKDNLKAIQDQQYNLARNLQDKIVDTLRQKYQKQKEEELKALEERVQKEIEIKQTELDALRKELEALQDETEDKKASLSAMKSELERWKKDDSVLAQAKIKDLEKRIAEREKELKIDELQKKIKDMEDGIKIIQDGSDEEKKTIEEKYKDLLNEQNLYSEATKIMSKSTQEEILNMLLEYEEKYKGMGDVLGKAFADALLSEIKSGLEGLNELTDGLDKPTNPLPPINNNTPLPDIKPPTNPTPVIPVTPTPPVITTIPWDGKYYQYGAKGETVKRIQKNLNAVGYNLAVDGSFGPATRTAVRDFQKNNGLVVDGSVGPATWEKLIKFHSGGLAVGEGFAIVKDKERVLTDNQTKAFDKLVFDILPMFANLRMFDNGIKGQGIIFNAPMVKNDISIVNNTPFDVNDNMDNLNNAIKQEIRTSGYRINLIR